MFKKHGLKMNLDKTGHTVRMKDDKLPKRAETKKQEGSRKRGRPQLRWEDCLKRDLRKAEEEKKMERKGQQQGPMEANHESSRTSQ